MATTYTYAITPAGYAQLTQSDVNFDNSSYVSTSSPVGRAVVTAQAALVQAQLTVLQTALADPNFTQP